MASIGIWACQWRELRPINFGGRPVVPTTNNGSANGDDADDGEGYARGRGRGRGRNGSAAYEMVGMSEQAESNV
jgi:hypothetical protein